MGIVNPNKMACFALQHRWSAAGSCSSRRASGCDAFIPLEPYAAAHISRPLTYLTQLEQNPPRATRNQRLVRRETGKEKRVKVPHGKGVANHTVPESCVGCREAQREALTGVRVGQPLSRESDYLQGADAVRDAEGNMDRRVIASAGPTLRGLRTWRARTLSGVDPFSRTPDPYG